MIKAKKALLLGFWVLSSIAYAQAPVIDESENMPLLEQQQANDVALAHAEAEDGDDQESSVAYEQKQAPLANQLPAADDARELNDAELVDKIQRLQQEVQELRGLLEVQAHDLKLLQQQQIAFYKDIDNRLQQHGNSSDSTAKTAFSLDSTEGKHSSLAKQESQKVSPKPSAKNNQLNPADEQISYLAAYELIQHKQYDAAIGAMQKFIAQYPQGGYIANAHYWLGELYLVKHEQTKAMQEFDRVLSAYPSSSKAAASMLKLAYALADMGEYAQAEKRLKEVIQKYPDTKTSNLAKEKLEHMQK